MGTIFAQSSRFGKSGIAVFRISGSSSVLALSKLIKNQDLRLIPRLMYYQKIYDPKNGELIDNAMVVYFKAPNSFTGEDVVEIHTHGSIAISKMLTRALINIEGLRLAEPGEFSRRAFLNNKFDLTAAEGIADLIEAETIWQHRLAIRQATGGLEDLYSAWREKLLTLISLLEVYIDFPDEDIPEKIVSEALSIVNELINTISLYLNDNRKGEILRAGMKLSVLGATNVGKSSLLNFLMKREIAIVSEIAGTTRDVIEGHLDIGGYPIILQDTAGIRDSGTDVIEQEGIRRSLAAAKNADIKVIMFDNPEMLLAANESKTFAGIKFDHNTILVLNKIDLNLNFKEISLEPALMISIKEKIGLDLLTKQIENIAANIANIDETPPITRERHRHQLEKALRYLSNFNINEDIVLAVEDVRMSIRELSNITGKITVDEILGEIFSNFCIGK